jgi:hypothetical protein
VRVHIIVVREPSADRPQQNFSQLSTANRANALSCSFAEQPTQLWDANVEKVGL